MLEKYKTPVWDSENSYRIPLKRGTVSGKVVTIKSNNHWLQTGDIIKVIASPGYEAFGATDVQVTLVDEDHFSYNVAVAPTIPFPNPQPGLSIVLWLTCDRYSASLVAPERIRIQFIPAGTVVQVHTRNKDLTWKNQKSLSESDGIVDLIFTQVFSEARLIRVSGTAIAPSISLSSKAPASAEAFGNVANNTYEIPEVIDLVGGGGGGGGTGNYKFSIGDTPPTTPSVGDWWLNSGNGTLYTYIDDGDTQLWVDLGDPGSMINNTSGGSGIVEQSTAMTGTGPNTIDAFNALTYRSAKYQMQISDGTHFETCNIFLIHDGTNVFLTTYGNVFSNASMGDFDATLAANTITLTFTATVSNAKTFKFIRSAISI